MNSKVNVFQEQNDLLLEEFGDIRTEVDSSMSVSLEVDADVEELGPFVQMLDARLHTRHVVRALEKLN